MLDVERKLKVTSWYVNTGRIVQVLGEGCFTKEMAGRLKRVAGSQMEKGLLVAMMSELTVDFIRTHSIRPLEQMLIQGTLNTGSLFTFDARFRSKGLSARDCNSNGGNVTLKCSLKDFGVPKEIVIKFHQSGLTTDSAWGALSGQPSVFVTGYVDEISDNTISCRPLVIGDLVESVGAHSFESKFSGSLEIRPEEFDAFSGVDFRRRIATKELDQLKCVSEDRVKKAFADILGEPDVPKDWGGEQCDLYSSKIVVDGQRTVCAFAFKGPSKFKPMEPSDCGKNGDQIVRLFDTGADVLVLQHCHAIKPAVRRTMEAFARSDFKKMRRFCLFDGYETLAVLKHFDRL